MKNLLVILFLTTSFQAFATDVAIVTSISLADLEKFEEVGGVMCSEFLPFFQVEQDGGYVNTAKKCRRQLREQAKQMGATLIGLEGLHKVHQGPVYMFGTAYKLRLPRS